MEETFKLLLNLVYSEKIEKNELRFLAVDTFCQEYYFYHSEMWSTSMVIISMRIE